MLSNKKNILQLVALMKYHGIEDVVVCPGSRNAAIVHTLSQCGLYRLHAVTDERSAGFQAIGMALATGHPVAICVTSGSALVNLHPAMAEAYYQQVPVVVISADRPAAWIGQMDGQTMPQPNALGQMVKTSVNLPEVKTDEDAWYCNRLINEALLECTHRTNGPVHINVPISEPFYEFNTMELPEERVIRRIEGLYPPQVRQLADLLRESHQRLIILGQKPADRQVRPAFMSELNRGYVSICEHLANCGEGSIAFRIDDSLVDELEQEENADMRPDLVITLCGHIVNKKLKQYLRKHPPRQHWHISPDGQVADLFSCLTTVVEAQPYPFLETLAYLTIPMDEENDYPTRWADLYNKVRAQEGNALPEEARLVGRLMALLPDDAVLHLANSSTVRYAQHFPLKPSVTVCCNRGINGIEGTLSSAVGFATSTPERPNFVVTGDLSFFYDQNALWSRKLPKNLHILLLNNGGGKIFETLPVPEDTESRSLITARHHTTAAAVAEEYGLTYMNDASQLTDFVAAEESTLLEVNF